MRLLCPKCHHPLDPATLSCINQHTFSRENDVIVLMDEALREKVNRLYDHRVDAVQFLPSIKDYNSLPCALADDHFEWRIRCYDVTLVNSLLGDGKQNILEIGAWNGWLTHHLSKAGHQVTAIEYSAHPDDGLGAKRHYQAAWQAIQMDLTALSIFEGGGDAIIINHGLHLFPDPTAYTQQVAQLLKPGGLLILLCLTFYRDPSQRVARVQNLQHTFLKPTRGYMDMQDKAALKAQGIRLIPYSQLWRANLKSLLRKTAPAYYYGVKRV